ncbi:MAG: metallophosphoesterase [bacterium]|nr:metallophosphoesterase [bacterium]
MAVMILFLILVLGLYVGAYIYVPRRLARLFDLKKTKIMYILFAVGAVSFPLAMTLHRHIGNEVTAFYYLIAATWSGFFLLLLTFLIDFEIINAFIKLPKKPAGIAVVGIALLLSAYALWNGHSFKVYRVDVPIAGLENELRILHLSDIHVDGHRGKKYLEKIVAACNGEKPDMVLITGDIADGRHSLKEDLFAPLEHLEAPVYFTTGNHENYAGRDKVIAILEKNNVRVLRNEIIHTKGIQLIGLDYMQPDAESFDMHPSKDKHTMKDVLNSLDISTEKPAILMHHCPLGMTYVNRHGIDLLLSGHTHAGQMYPVSLCTWLIYTYNRGLYTYNGTHIYVSQGAGTFGPRMRLGTENEITLITLTHKTRQHM